MQCLLKYIYTMLLQNPYGTSVQTIKQWKYYWYLDFLSIFGLLTVKNCFILILKNKWHSFDI